MAEASDLVLELASAFTFLQKEGEYDVRAIEELKIRKRSRQGTRNSSIKLVVCSANSIWKRPRHSQSSMPTAAVFALDSLLVEYRHRNPGSYELFRRSQSVLPGGNTRTGCSSIRSRCTSTARKARI